MGAIKKAVLFFLLVRVLALPGYWLLPERYAPLDLISPALQSNYLNWSWANFDGEHYLSIASDGYTIRNGFPQYAFFPLYPVLIKLSSYLFHDYLLSGLLVSFASVTAIFYLFPRWLKLLQNKNPMFSPWTMVLVPGGVFLASVYTEPLFIALALAVFCSAEQRQWGRAALFAGLSTAARVNGIFLVLFLAVKMWQNRLKPKLLAAYGLLSFSGILSYMTFLYLRTGNALSWYGSQAYWGKSEATSPAVTAANYFRAVTVEFKPDLTHFVVAVEIGLTLWALYLVVTVIRRRLLSLPYQLYLAGNITMPILTGSLGSMPRFFLMLFPTVVVLTPLTSARRLPILAAYFILFVTGIILFTRGYWWA